MLVEALVRIYASIVHWITGFLNIPLMPAGVSTVFQEMIPYFTSGLSFIGMFLDPIVYVLLGVTIAFYITKYTFLVIHMAFSEIWHVRRIM